MYYNNSNRSRAARARGFAALCAMLAMGLVALASSAEAAPFAYVANEFSGTVSVIDTATNPPSVVAMVPLPVWAGIPNAVAVTPDGKHVYVANLGSLFVLVIDTATNTVVARVAVGGYQSYGVAVTPDGKHVYVAGSGVSVIDTATNTVGTTVPVGDLLSGVAVAPDGKHAYVTGGVVIDTATNTVVARVLVGGGGNGVAITPDGKHVYFTGGGFGSPSNVSVIATASNTVVATIPVGGYLPSGLAVTPDGKHVYVTNSDPPGTVLVIDTATNMVVGTPIPVGVRPVKVAVTPDGKHVYVTIANNLAPPGTVSVIDTASNMVVATVTVGRSPNGVAIVPPPPGVPFLAFNAKLEIDLDSAPNEDAFELNSNFTLSSTAPRINPVKEAVKLQVGTFTATIPPGSFKKHRNGSFTFEGVIDGVSLEARIKPAGTLRYAFHAEATDASLTGTVNTVYVTLIIGGDSGATSVTAAISP